MISLADPLQHPRPVGRVAGLSLPPVVFGISALGNLYQAMPLAQKQAIVKASREHTAGAAVFDGAGKYGAGLALEVLGDSLRAQGVGADDVIISNKLAWRRAPLPAHGEPTFEPGVWKELQHDAVMDISEAGIIRCYEEGLALVGKPYRTDLVSIHDPDEYLAAATDATDRARRMDDVRGAYRALIRLRTEGRVKAVGIGSKDWRVLRDIVAEVDVDWVMLACSLTIMAHPPELVAWVAAAAKRGIAVINSAVFHGGFLIGSDHLDYQLVDPARPDHARALAWRARFQALCATHGVTPAAACVNFALRVPGVASIALNTSRAEMVASNVAMPAAHIPAALWRDLSAAGLIDAHLVESRLGFLA